MGSLIRHIRRAIAVGIAAAAPCPAGAPLFADAARRGIENLPGYEYRRLHFGFLIGVNATDFHIYNTGVRTTEGGETALYGEVLELSPGINLGIVGDLRLCKNLNLRCLPGISFGERVITFTDELGAEVEQCKIKSTFVDVPILLKYSAYRMRNAKPYVVGGATARYDLSKDKQSHLTFKSLDAYWDLGAGMDIYLPYFRFSVEVRGSFGLTNIYNPNGSQELEDIPFVKAIDRIKSRMFGLTFYFE